MKAKRRINGINQQENQLAYGQLWRHQCMANNGGGGKLAISSQ